MPINYPQFRRLTAADMGGLGGIDLAKSISSGLQNAKDIQEARYRPQQLQQEAYARQLANTINEAKAKYAAEQELANLNYRKAGTSHLGAQTRNIEAEMGLLPYRQRLLEAQASRAQQLANQPYGGNLSGIAKEAYGLAQITGQDPKEIAQKLYQNKLDQAQALNEYRQSLIQTAPKRVSSQLAKIEQEKQEVAQGFAPGTNGAIKLTSDQQQDLLGKYNLQQQKMVTDYQTRQKTLSATNIDKTIESINPDSLVRYAGIVGSGAKTWEQTKAPFNQESKEYKNYTNDVKKVKLLAHQIRQFYGDSIQPAMTQAIEDMVNPATWKNNPELAKSNYNAIIDILKQETGTYRSALKNIKSYEEQLKNNNITKEQALAELQRRRALRSQ